MQRGEHVGRYLLEAPLGRGGMGEVWRATDTKLNRPVAIKLLLHHEPDDVARFKREAEVAGNLKHPGIAAIHEFGEAVTGPFLAMQLVDGVTLDRAHLGVFDVARAMRDAALAVDHAHAQGVVHRDLKPHNIMISFASLTPTTKTGAGERPAAWQVTVMDFGLAKRVAGPSSLSVSGMAMGTPAYMSPEQASGRTDIDARADLYALGATMYSLVTGRPPFNSSDVALLLADVIETEPVAPRRLNPAIPPDLQTIILKCLEKNRERRYATSAALADDLTCFLEGDPIQARPASMAYVAWKRLKKRPITAGIVTALSALLVAAVAFAVNRYVVALRSERAATQSMHKAEESAEKLRREMELQMLRVRAGNALRPATETLWLWEMNHVKAPPVDEAAARAAIDESLKILPGYGPALVERGRYLLLMGEFEAAMASLAEAMGDPAAKADALYQRARMALFRYVFLMPAPRIVLAPNRLRLDLSMRKSPPPEDAQLRDSAIRDLEAYIALVPSGESDPRVQWAQQLLEYARADTMESFRAVAERMRTPVESLRVARWEALLYLGSAWFDGERFDKAAEAFREAIRLTGPGPYLWNMLGASLWAASKQPLANVDLKEALYAFDRAVGFTGEDPLLHYNRALVLRDMERREEAMESADRAVALRSSADFLGLRALLRYEARDAEGAKKDYDKAIELSPTEPLLRANRAVVRRALKDDDGAMEDLNAALKIDPDCASALINRSGLKKKLGDLEGAVGDASKAIQIDPTHPGAWLNRGNAKVAQKDYRGAVSDWTKFIELAPDHAFVATVKRDIADVRKLLEDEK